MLDVSVTIPGNLTADPELYFTANGIPVAGFTVAHTPRRFNKDTNAWEDHGDTLFLRCSAWRGHGENVAGSLHKGDAVIVVGALRARSYETKEGEKRTSVECEVEAVSVDLRRQAVASVIRNGKAAPTNQPGPDEAWAPAETVAA